jgi:pre-mRNA-splicing factor CDC5/CEF1
MGPARFAMLKEVDMLAAQEKALQSLYGKLEREKREYETRAPALEELFMEEVKRLNVG